MQLETITQSEAMRRRYRYLSHFSLTTTFQVPFHCWLFYVYHHISLLFLIGDLLFFSCVKLIWILHYLPMPCFHSWMKSRNVKSCGSNLPTRYVYLGSVDIFQPQHKSLFLEQNNLNLLSCQKFLQLFSDESIMCLFSVIMFCICF